MAAVVEPPHMEVLCLGAGQDVGRSCIIVSMGGKRVMLDCGAHMGYRDHRRFPDFALIRGGAEGAGMGYTAIVDCVIISHFHLDHCGALPYFTEVCGYDGPVYMTHPTRALSPVLLEDYRKITADRNGTEGLFTAEDISRCMDKVLCVNIHEQVQVDDELQIKAYYAGHVLGAAMFEVRVGIESVVYTGDYNMTADRHLGPAWIDRALPDLLITESTYGATVRDLRRHREKQFLQRVHDCVTRGGKVLIPVFAVGRAQELCILLDTYWEQTGFTVPIYFSEGMAQRANEYYKLYVNWTNEKIKTAHRARNMFDFKHIRTFEQPDQLKQPTPMVLFASPGMLHTGLSLEMFKQWAPDARNLVIIPGYCVKGTVGAKLIMGKRGRMQVDRQTTVDVKCQVLHLTFSAHADAKGIMQLIRHSGPRHVMLVHGEQSRMEFLKRRIAGEFRIPVHNPANGETVRVPTRDLLPCQVSTDLQRGLSPDVAADGTDGHHNTARGEHEVPCGPHVGRKRLRRVAAEEKVQGVMVLSQDRKEVALMSAERAAERVGLQPHVIINESLSTAD